MVISNRVANKKLLQFQTELSAERPRAANTKTVVLSQEAQGGARGKQTVSRPDTPAHGRTNNCLKQRCLARAQNASLIRPQKLEEKKARWKLARFLQ